MDTSLKNIKLLGAQTSTKEFSWIEASLKDLICIGEMIQSPVLVFNLIQLRVPVLSVSKALKFDL
jgi:hypothetical protein